MSKHKKFNIDSEKIGWIVFYISMATVFIWIILKLAGVIHSPLWQDVIPSAGLFIGIFAIALTMGRSLGLIKPIYDAVKDIKKRLSQLEKSHYSLAVDYKRHIQKHHS